MKRFLPIILILPLGLFSQYKRVVFVETGTSLNQSFKPKEIYSGEEYSYHRYPWWNCRPVYYSTVSDVHRISTYSFYAKIGIERNFIERKHFSMSFPFVLGYREKKENIQVEATQFPTNGPTEKFHLSHKLDSKMASLVFGPKIIMRFNRWACFTNLNFNMDIPLYIKYSYANSSEFGDYVSSYEWQDYGDPIFTLGLQNGVMYNLSDKVAIGLTNDVFFYNIETAFYGNAHLKQYNHLFNLGYGTNSTIINTGIRLQYSF